LVALHHSRMLLIEDDPYDVELIRLAFEDHPLLNQIDIVSDGEQALQYLFDYDSLNPRPLPRLILLDLKLPKVSGLRVLEAIRSHSRTRQLIVVVMSSSQEDNDLHTCYDLGVNSYIVKPLDLQQFLEVARQVGLYWMQINQPPLRLLGW
jgi:two-component system, response regulator